MEDDDIFDTLFETNLTTVDDDGNHVVRDCTDQGHVNQLSSGTTSWATTWSPSLTLIDLSINGRRQMDAYTDGTHYMHRAAVLAVNRHLRKLRVDLGLIAAVDPHAGYVPVAVLHPDLPTELITVKDYRVTPRQITRANTRINRRGLRMTTDVDAKRGLIDEYNRLVGNFVNERADLLARIFDHD